jgi:methylmalonyl-CoA/ethylmalonyl-CoA epimerase
MSMARHGSIDQLGILVDDLDASIAHWISTLGVGPWTVFRNVRLDARYQGRSGVVTMDVGLSYQGSAQIELIQATNDAPSPYRDADGQKILGLHHIAWIVDDLDTAVDGAIGDGMELVFEAANPGTRVAYLRMPGEAGLLLEFIQGQGMREMVRAGIAATNHWDGSDPVHVIDFAA